jgi:hypothetical protein
VEANRSGERNEGELEEENKGRNRKLEGSTVQFKSNQKDNTKRPNHNFITQKSPKKAALKRAQNSNKYIRKK